MDLTPKFLSFALAAALTASMSACSRTPSGAAQEPALGVRLSEAPAVRLEATRDGRHLVFITSPTAAAGPDVPEGIRLGTMAAVPSEGGAVRRLGTGVSTLEGAYQLSGSRLAFLEGFDISKGAGTLSLADLDKPEEAPRQLAGSVTFHRFSPGGAALAYVADGALHLMDMATGSDAVIDRDVATFEFSASASKLLYRKPWAAGGGLFLADVGSAGQGTSRSAPIQLAERVGDYGFSPDGRFVALTSRTADGGAPYSTLVLSAEAPQRKVLAGERSGSFQFSPDGKVLAFIADQTPGMPYGELSLLSLDIERTFSGADGRPGTEIRRLGGSVADFRFSPDGSAIAFRQNMQNGKGQAWQEFQAVRVPSGEVRLHQKSKPKTFISFEFSGDGKELAFIRHNGAQLDLWRAAMADSSAPEAVAPWTYEYHYVAPAGGTAEGLPLWYRGNCVREGRDCTLFAAPPLTARASASAPSDVSPADAGAPSQADGGTGAPQPQAEKAPAYPRHPDLARGISGFTLSPSGRRLFLHTPCLDVTDAFDLHWVDTAGVLETLPSRRLVDRHVLQNSLVALDPDGTRVAYVVTGKKRAGVYVAELPAPRR